MGIGVVLMVTVCLLGLDIKVEPDEETGNPDI